MQIIMTIPPPKQSFLVEFQRQVVGVKEEDKALAGEAVDADGLVGNAQGIEFVHGSVDIIDLKGQMAQAGGLGAGDTLGRIVEREELYHILAVQCEVGLVGLGLGPVVLGLDSKAQLAGVEIEAALVVGADDGDVVNLVET